MFCTPSDEEKDAVWKAYHEHRPIRVPLRWGANPRIILLNHKLNPHGWGFEQYCSDPHVTCVIQSRFQEYMATVLGRYSDVPASLPDAWTFSVDNQNIYDGAYFGGKVEYREGQTPAIQAFLAEQDMDDFLARDFSRPLENPGFGTASPSVRRS